LSGFNFHYTPRVILISTIPWGSDFIFHYGVFHSVFH